MLGLIYRFVQNSRLARWIAFAFGAVAVAMGWRALERRDAASDALAKRDAQDAQANEDAHERINEADTGAGLDDAQRRERLRKFAAKHGNRPPKAGRE